MPYITPPSPARRGYIVVLLGTTLAYAALLSALSILRNWNLLSSVIDAASFSQVLWTFLESGAPTLSTVPPYEPIAWLGFHFSPLVLALAPLYAAFPAPELLSALQGTAIALAMPPLFYTCRRLGASDNVALLWCLLFALHPNSMNGGSWDFHEQALAVPLFAWGIWAVVARRFAVLVLCCILVLLVKEHYGASVAGFGLLWALMHKDYTRGVALAAFGALAAYLIIFQLMPSIRGHGEHMMFEQGGTHFARYAWLKKPLPKAVEFFFSTIMGDPRTPIYLLVLVGAFLGLPLFAPALLLPGAADFVVNMLSSVYMPRSPFAYHSLTLMPLLAAAACAGAEKIRKRAPQVYRPLVITCALLTLGTGYYLNPMPLPMALTPWEPETVRLAPDPRIAEIKPLLPPETRLSVQSNISAPFGHYRMLVPFPDRLDAVDAVLLHLDNPLANKTGTPFGLPYMHYHNLYVAAVEEFLKCGEFGLIYWNPPWAVLRRGQADAFPRDEAAAALAQLKRAMEIEEQESGAPYYPTGELAQWWGDLHLPCGKTEISR